MEPRYQYLFERGFRDLRVAMEVSLHDISRRTGMSPADISSLERTHVIATESQRKQLWNALKDAVDAKES